MIADAVMAGVLLAMFLFEFGLGAPGEHSVVPATVIESRVDEFIDGQGR